VFSKPFPSSCQSLRGTALGTAAISYYGNELSSRSLKNRLLRSCQWRSPWGVFKKRLQKKCQSSCPSLRGAALGTAAISYYGNELTSRSLKKQTASFLAVTITLGESLKKRLQKKCQYLVRPRRLRGKKCHSHRSSPKY
jgi:hypothetical protein